MLDRVCSMFRFDSAVDLQITLHIDRDSGMKISKIGIKEICQRDVNHIFCLVIDAVNRRSFLLQKIFRSSKSKNAVVFFKFQMMLRRFGDKNPG